MDTIQLSPAEIELIKLNREKEEIAEREKAIQDEIKYQEYLKHRDEWVIKIQTEQKTQNYIYEQFYKKLVQEIGKLTSIILEEGNRTEYYPEYYNEKLKDEDKQPPLELTHYQIKNKWGYFHGITKDFRSYLPYSLSSRNQTYKFKTIVQNIKNKINSDIVEQNQKNKLEAAKQNLINKFKTEYPGCQVEYKQEYQHNYHVRGGNGYYIETLKITFINTSWVKIRFYQDESWGIQEKFDSKAPETKEEWLEYLSK
jgi:hypothetical protein